VKKDVFGFFKTRTMFLIFNYLIIYADYISSRSHVILSINILITGIRSKN